MAKSISRRDVLRTLGMGAMAGSVLRVIPMQAAEYAHNMVQAEKASAAGGYTPKFFSPHQYKILQALCETIIPAEDGTGGAIEAGATEFIDLLTSENTEYQLKLGGGLKYLYVSSEALFGQVLLYCICTVLI